MNHATSFNRLLINLDKYLLQKTQHDETGSGAVTPPSILVVSDENLQSELVYLKRLQGTVHVITNRFDLYSFCGDQDISANFNDFDFISLPQNRYDIGIYRISKERAVSHHVLNSLSEHIVASGLILLGGKKNEGIKNYTDKCKSQLGMSGSLVKHGDFYIASLTQANASLIEDKVQALLDDKDYTTCQEVPIKSNKEAAPHVFFSKPGLYGWDKIDRGSEFLIETLLSERDLCGTMNDATSLNYLDLGCGYGFLSIMLLERLIAKLLHSTNAQDNAEPKIHLSATDNNAAAVAMCEHNLDAYIAKHSLALSFEVSADDCGATLSGKYEVILCNPPFHQGFSTEPELTEKFITAAKRLISASGRAYFVVNVFIPLERLAGKHFKKVTTLANNQQFKVIELKHALNLGLM
ncbi:MAG: 16S rRNA (guanine1207-N2)-methyltransferase [Lentisphaeria bacterium]|jgi:16S rRNA (guanine1207-N2)-methyltransferase